jgi:transposase InsO family protein
VTCDAAGLGRKLSVYGVRKVWRQLHRQGVDVARCTTARLMREMGLVGVIRGKSVKTTVSSRAAPCPLDRVNRQFQASAPNALWLADFTYVATWQGFVYVAFIHCGLAAAAAIARPADAFDLQVCRNDVELLGDILADWMQRALTT